MGLTEWGDAADSVVNTTFCVPPARNLWFLFAAVPVQTGLLAGVAAAVIIVIVLLVVGFVVYRRTVVQKQKKLLEEYSSQLQMVGRHRNTCK